LSPFEQRSRFRSNTRPDCSAQQLSRGGLRPLFGQLARHRVAVARNDHRAGAADPGRVLHLAVEGLGHGHEVRPIVVQHLGRAELVVLGVARPVSVSTPASVSNRLGLFDTCPGGAPLPRASLNGGQVSNKPRGRKPRRTTRLDSHAMAFVGARSRCRSTGWRRASVRCRCERRRQRTTS